MKHSLTEYNPGDISPEARLVGRIWSGVHVIVSFQILCCKYIAALRGGYVREIFCRGGTGEMSSEGVSHSPRIEAVGFTIVCVTF